MNTVSSASMKDGGGTVLPPPRELRDTFDLLTRLDATFGLDLLAVRIDWRGVAPQQVCHAVLGRLPQDLVHSGLSQRQFEPSGYFKSLLLSAEFQNALVSNLLGAFPEKQRRFFVHVPRSGGTSLGQTLAEHACTIPHTAMEATWCGGNAFLQSAAEICRNVKRHDAIHVSGHYTLRSIVDGRLARFGDSIWTSFRTPQEIILSFINYVVTILHADPDITRPDTRHWAKLLGLKAPIGTLSPKQLRMLLPRMLRNHRLLPKDMLCHFLGDGTAASALDLLAAADVEIIDQRRLDAWRAQHWTVPAKPWANVSRRFFAWHTIEEGERRQINALIREDATLHQAVQDVLGSDVSVRGMQLACIPRARAAASALPRMRRAARPILLDPGFGRTMPGLAGISPAVSWADPPLHYRTIETTLRLPMLESRIRIRYARRDRSRIPLRAFWRRRLRSIFARLNTLRAR